jgi:hypothetical protein
MRKHDQVISILKPGKDPALPPSYRPISLLDTIGKLFEKILLARILSEVSETSSSGWSEYNTPCHSPQLLTMVKRTAEQEIWPVSKLNI